MKRLLACLGTFVGGLALGCSLSALDTTDCTGDDQCVTAFGIGFSCIDGVCEQTECELDIDCGAGQTCESGVCGASDETDGDVDCTDPDEVCPLQLADSCISSDVPVIESSAAFYAVDTTGLSDSFRDLGGCLDADVVGNDGFVAIDMTAGERWHFHIKVQDEVSNPAVYVLQGSCDTRTCQAGDGLDVCGPGTDEHVSFEAPEAGRYYVGVDARASGGAQFELLAARPVCGNGGEPEHSEACEDGNVVAGDGCDDECRPEISAARPDEVEPNDDQWGSNVLMFDQETQAVAANATLGGRCDSDMFLVRVAQGQSIRATMGDAGGNDCSGEPGITMTLVDGSGFRTLGTGSNRGSNACPSFTDEDGFASDLSEGTYFVVTTADESADSFDYRLDVELVDAEEG